MSVVAASQAVLSGPFFDPAHVEALREHVATRMAGPGKALGTKVRAAAPVGPSGKLRDSVTVKVGGKKTKRVKSVRLTVEANARRAGTEGDSPKRYGRPPYGVFSDHETGWLTDTVNGEAPALRADFQGAVGEFAQIMNAGAPAPAASNGR